MIPIVNYGILEQVLTIGLLGLLPLFYSSPIEIGGLGFPPATIGTFLAMFGIVDGMAQAFLGAKLIERFGPKKVFRSVVLFFYPLILFFPIISAVVTAHGKVGPVVFVLLAIQLIFRVAMDLAFRVYVQSLERLMISPLI